MQSTTVTIRPVQGRALGIALLSDYWMLTKPEVNFLIVITTLAGFYLASPLHPWRILLLFNTLLGTLLVASGTGVLNQVHRTSFRCERRTSRRPLPAERIVHSHALWFGLVLSTAGGLWLAIFANLLASLIRSADAGYIFALLHSAEKTDSTLHFGWRISGRGTTPDRTRRRGGQNNLGGLVALRDSLPVAVPAFYGDCLDVSRGLCAGGISHLTSWTKPGTSHGLADAGFLSLACAAHARAFTPRAGRFRVLSGSSSCESRRISLLLCALGNVEIEPGCSSITIFGCRLSIYRSCSV